MKKLAAGVYEDGEGALHIVADEVLEAAGYEASEENARRLYETLGEIAGEEIPGSGSIWTDEPLSLFPDLSPAPPGHGD